LVGSGVPGRRERAQPFAGDIRLIFEDWVLHDPVFVPHRGRGCRRSPVAAYLLVARPRQLGWGATERESRDSLSGDDLLAHANLTATRAITIRASADRIWPWIAQLGQGRGGFYSYDWLENLVGCDIHSADRIVLEWQDVAVGDEVRLAPEVALVVASVQPGRSLVLRGGIPLGSAAPPYDFTWAFALRDAPDGTTRVLVRERYAFMRIPGPRRKQGRPRTTHPHP
jgi:hypothetical protein